MLRSAAACLVRTLLVLLSAASLVPFAMGQSSGWASGAVTSQALPLVFEQNAGQLPAGDLFAGRTQGYSLSVRADELRFSLPGRHASRTISLSFRGGRSQSAEGLSESAFRTNVYLGNDATRWHSGIRNFNRVALHALYPGVDAELYARAGELEHDFILAPGADASSLAMTLAGAQTVSLSAAGDVVLTADEGSLRLHKPMAYQMLADGSRREVEARFELAQADGSASLRFALGAYDHSRRLVIDPVISYATYVSGSLGSTPTAVVSDTAGNVYLTGYTYSPQATFAASAANGSVTPGTTTSGDDVAFVAKLASSANGAQIAWITYYGSAHGALSGAYQIIQPNGIALQSSTVYIAGQTYATDLPTGSVYQPAPIAPVAGEYYGFAASFDAGTGAFSRGTYVDAGANGGSTAISALSVSASGVTLAGQTTGMALPVTSNALFVPVSVIVNTSLNKGFLLQLTLALDSENYGTYINGTNAATTTDTYLTGVATDSSGNIYISGKTRGSFPQAGAYASAAMNTPSGGKTGYNSFAAKLVPSTQTLGYSFWSGGSADDEINGLALDASGNLFLFGTTASTDFVTNASATSTTVPSATPTTPLDPNYPAGAAFSGFVVKLDPSGGLLSNTYLGATGSTTTAAQAGSTDAAGNVYIVGKTNAVKAVFPQMTHSSTTVAATGYTLLASGQDLTVDSTSSSAVTRAFLVKMPSSLSTVSYLAYLGPSAGTASGTGVGLDSQQNAYVLLADKPNSGAAYATASAAQPLPQVADGNTTTAYIAKVVNATPASQPSLVAGTQSYTPATVGYLSTTNYSTIQLTWQVVGAASGASTVVFNLPYSTYLQPYALTDMTVSVAGTAVSGLCTLGTATTANTTPGLTCVVPTLAAGATAQFVLSAGISSAATTTSPSSFSLPATAYDAQGDALSLSQTVSTAGIPTFTVTNTTLQTSINAALSTTDTTTPNATVTYSYQLKNTSSSDSPATTLSTNLGSSSYAFTPTLPLSSTGCDPTLTACDVPANTTLTYTVTGVYLSSQFGSAAGPFTVTTSAPTVTWTPSTGSTSALGSSSSVTVSIYKQPQTITFTGPASPVVYGVSPITLSATASSSLPVTFSVISGPGTISGSVLTVTGAGTIVLAADQSGATNYAAATQVQQTLVVNKASLTLTASPLIITTGQTGSMLFTLAGPGVVPSANVTYTILNSTGGTAATGTLTPTVGSSSSTVSVPVASTLSAGSYTVSVTYAGDANYLASASSAVALTVSQASQTITFTAPATPVTFGVSPLTLTASSTSSLAVSFTVTSGPATVNGTTLSITGAGTVVVTATQAGSTNYSAATPVARTLVVNKAVPGVVLTSSAAAVFSQNSVNFSAAVSSAAGAPSGSISFFDGTTQLGTATIASGSASLPVSTLSVGSHSITAVYAGDANFASLTSNIVSESVQDFTLAVTNSTLTVARGATGSYTVALTPSSSTLPANVTFSVSGLPADVTGTFTPSVVNAGSAAAQVTLTVQVPTTHALLERRGIPNSGMTTTILALILLPFGGRMRRASRTLRRGLSASALLLLAFAAMTALQGCGSSTTVTAPESFNTTITATSGSLTHTTGVTLVIQ